MYLPPSVLNRRVVVDARGAARTPEPRTHPPVLPLAYKNNLTLGFIQERDCHARTTSRLKMHGADGGGVTESRRAGSFRRRPAAAWLLEGTPAYPPAATQNPPPVATPNSPTLGDRLSA